MPTFRRLRPAVAAVLALMAALPLTFAHAGDTVGDDLLACPIKIQGNARHLVEKLPKGWARINSPDYGQNEGDARITDAAVPATQPRWLYITNGKMVRLSTDAGCHWDYVYPGPSATDNVPGGGMPSVRTVSQIATPSAGVLWLASYDSENGVYHPHVEMTTDATPKSGGGTKAAFTTVERGLPAVGRPLALQPSPANANYAYLLIEGVGDPTAPEGTAARTVYRLDQNPQLDKAGLSASWTAVTAPNGFGRIEGMATSPALPSNVWIWSGSTYAVSTDGGVSWKTGTTEGRITAVDVDERSEASIFAQAADGPTGVLVSDAGTKIGTLAPPEVVTSVVHGQRSGVYVVAGPKGTFGYDVTASRWVALQPAGVAPFVSVGLGATRTGRILIGQSAGALYRWDLFPGESFLRPPTGLHGEGFDGFVPTSDLTAPELNLTTHEVTVRPGQHAVVNSDFGVQPMPSPLDVFFLMDTTTSMQKSLDSLKGGIQNIASDITRRTHGSACFGLGEFRDEGAVSTNAGVVAAYKRDMPIQDCDNPDKNLAEFRVAADALKEGGGNQNEREADTIALWQAVKGDGQTNPAVLPGQQANFRPGDVTRVIVLVTDAGFMQGGGFPSISSTVQMLNSRQVKVVGVVVRDNNNETWATDDMTQVVAGTDTYAPFGGVDCDGDHLIDAVAGAPLICHTDGNAPNLGAAITSLLLAVPSPGTLAVVPQDPGHVVVSVKGALSQVFNLRVENHLANTFTLACAAAQDGKDLALKLTGTVHGIPLATATVVVRCRAVHIIPKIPKIPPPPPLPDPPIVIHPVIAPVVIPQFQPPPVQNPPSNINPNAGFSQQEEQQFQLATVSQDASEQQQDEEEVELAMSAVHQNDAAAAGFVLGCATFVTIAAAAGVAHRRRTQRATSPAYTRAR
jgi:hypothetical protein